MNRYTYDTLAIGKAEQFEVKVTEKMMEQFEAISGDNNPLHKDEGYAREQGMEGRVVYGLLTASFYSQLVGVHLPGVYCFLQEIKTTFRKPVYIGDTLTVKGEVTKKHDTFKRITIKATITSERGKVSQAEIIVGVMK